MSDLNEHFSKSYQELLTGLKENKKMLESFGLKLTPKFPEMVDLYEEFHEEFKRNRQTFEENSSSLSASIKKLGIQIGDKISNPFNVRQMEATNLIEYADKAAKDLEQVLLLIERDNDKNLKIC